MKTYTLSIVAAAIGMMATSCSQKMNELGSLENTVDSVSYAIGLNVGQNLKQNKAGDLNYDALRKGIEDMLTNDSNLAISKEVSMTLMQEYFMNRFNEEANANLEKAKQWLETNKSKEGVVSLESGTQYRILRQGDGPIPTEEDQILAHYTGMLIDGKVFDSSVERGEPLKFVLGEMIPGWKEAITKMPVGSKWELFIPPQLAYGESGTRDGSIPPNAVLIFEVELLDIIKNSDEATAPK
jgi:FKBP-type peptidyl-prolyl cis-trans isomerase